jgi:hypothetical protein
MLAFPQSERIFRWGVRVGESATYFSRPTPTTMPFANGAMPALCLWGFSSRGIFIHCCYILCLVTGVGSGNRQSSAHTGVGICRMLNIDFREFAFQALRGRANRRVAHESRDKDESSITLSATRGANTYTMLLRW